MRNYDLSCLHRNAVGFDRIFKLLDGLATDAAQGGYPPYDIEKVEENAYRITLAVAGFGKEDITIEAQNGTLLVKGQRKDEDRKSTFLHRGIATRAFERRFQLAEYVEVTGADLANGLLSIDLVREIPEAKKPRRIEIGTTKVLEAKAA
jgi:molecular chaperone IbpA